jgi:hypothetical protein
MYRWDETRLEDKIVLFPKVREQLKKEIDKAMEQGNYETALDTLKQLQGYKHHSHLVHVQTLICLIKLQHWDEARDFCEDLLIDEHGEHYYDYFDYYVMILYEEKRFSEVIEVIKDERVRKSIPEQYAKKLNEIEQLAGEMNEWAAIDLVTEIQQAVVENLPQKQYYLLQKWKQLGVKAPASFYLLLKEEKVHPMIKTMLLHQFQMERLEESVTIKKLGKQQTMVPAQVKGMKEHPVYLQTKAFIEFVEQEDPSLYHFIVEVFDQYCMVIYPFFYRIEEVAAVGEAFIQFAKQLLYGVEESPENEAYMEGIRHCHQLYHDVVQ